MAPGYSTFLLTVAIPASNGSALELAHARRAVLHWATAAAVANTSAGIDRCSFHVIATGFSPEC